VRDAVGAMTTTISAAAARIHAKTLGADSSPVSVDAAAAKVRASKGGTKTPPFLFVRYSPLVIDSACIDLVLLMRRIQGRPAFAKPDWLFGSAHTRDKDYSLPRALTGKAP
jgi:hypothetical protein